MSKIREKQEQTPTKACDSHQTLPQNIFLSFDIVKSKPLAQIFVEQCLGVLFLLHLVVKER